MNNLVNTILNSKCSTILGGISDSEIAAAESKLRLKFSAEYKEYLSACGMASFDSHELTGICNFPRLNVIDVTEEERLRDPQIDREWYVIERTGNDGAIVWQDKTGKVFGTIPGKTPLELADSIYHYIE